MTVFTIFEIISNVSSYSNVGAESEGRSNLCNLLRPSSKKSNPSPSSDAETRQDSINTAFLASRLMIAYKVCLNIAFLGILY